MKDYEDFNSRDARLVVLRELHKQRDGTMNDTAIQYVLDLFGHRRSREWVRSQLLKMEEVGALVIRGQGSVLVATITRAGIDHIERRSFLDGINSPSPEA